MSPPLENRGDSAHMVKPGQIGALENFTLCAFDIKFQQVDPLESELSQYGRERRSRHCQ